jgi:hypothetical protein
MVTFKDYVDYRLNEAKDDDPESAGYHHAREAGRDLYYADTIRAHKRDILRQNPHKQNHPHHKLWHKGAKEGHADAHEEARTEDGGKDDND